MAATAASQGRDAGIVVVHYCNNGQPHFGERPFAPQCNSPPAHCTYGKPDQPLPRMRPRNRVPFAPMCGSLILPIVLMRSSAMRSAAL